MNPPAMKGARNYLHRSLSIVAPSPNMQLVQTAVAGWKKGGVPTEQAVNSEWLVVMVCGVQHHVHHPVYLAIGGCQCTDINAQPPGD
jgi:hypothetical protein